MRNDDNTRNMRGRLAVLAAVAALLALAVVALPWAGDIRLTARALAAERSIDRGAEVCTKCHDKPPATEIGHTAHGVKADPRTPFAQQGCVVCHGPSTEHVETKPAAPGDKRPPPTVVFAGPATSPAQDRTDACLGCHKGEQRINWHTGAHAGADVSCSDCHDLHRPRDRALAADSQPGVCFRCHTEQRAQSMQMSHHPVREGKVTCSDCHNPHGSPTRAMLREGRVNDTCYGCHADKRGPLLWEHQPVREDCTLCHSPHGANATAMLKQRMPYLCSGCHAGTGGGMGGSPYGHQSLPGGASSASVRMQMRSCLNCHPQIHGSNSPSGAVFMR